MVGSTFGLLTGNLGESFGPLNRKEHPTSGPKSEPHHRTRVSLLHNTSPNSRGLLVVTAETDGKVALSTRMSLPLIRRGILLRKLGGETSGETST